MADRHDASEAPSVAANGSSLRKRLLRSVGRFARERHGGGAVEFAMVAPLFFGTMFVFLETGMMHWQDRLIQTYASDLARFHRTGFLGTVQEKDKDGKTIRRDVDLCRDRVVGLMFDCEKMVIDVRLTDDLSPLRNKAGKVTGNKIDPGGSGSVNVVRVFYQQKPMFGISVGPIRQLNEDGTFEYYGASGFVKE